VPPDRCRLAAISPLDLPAAVAPGARTASPAATVRIASARSSGWVSLSRKPLAPARRPAASDPWATAVGGTTLEIGRAGAASPALTLAPDCYNDQIKPNPACLITLGPDSSLIEQPGYDDVTGIGAVTSRLIAALAKG